MIDLYVRPMTNAEKRAAVEAELKAHPEDSDREIARRVGVSPDFVNRLHHELSSKDTSSENPAPTEANEQNAATAPVDSLTEDERQELYYEMCRQEHARLGIPIWAYAPIETAGLDAPAWLSSHQAQQWREAAEMFRQIEARDPTHYAAVEGFL